ncbi:N-acetylgalactosamine kinase [Zootermopsis nevadensis]|uniref:N-acetylgalactosamine kinase n=1 Tax=Zootermopsis nevadensis TaxID=136037 RepID=A0A067RJ52_ZOONE|nr:N-acetylgalactosamine kinase [Zootermopsis nevadensis]XP_021942397.1 N-acetylgalactosamine kinase [Zootermopsis nevadensis]KDR23048.1 N-acetylgalactosamine kinase [Zootermopsis nevadensis]
MAQETNSGLKNNYPPLLQLQGSKLHNVRVTELMDHFVVKYKQEPEFLVRVPGRVNLIGEHVDYCGYSVLPMAIQYDIMVAVKRISEPQLYLTNMDSSHSDFQCPIHSFSIEVKKGVSPHWYNYFLCGLKGVLEALPQDSVGMFVAVTGNVPQQSGLSSSSALVSAAALAAAHANNLKMTKLEIASLSATSERYIGTEGGGMDQAIAFLGTRGCAKHIQFNPLRSEDVKLPDGVVFVIAHSLAVLNKAKTSDFNCRVAECRLASQIMAKKRGLSWEKVSSLADLQSTMTASLGEMIALVKEFLHEQPYSKEEICRELEVSGMCLDQLSLSNNTTDINQFKLHQRALHVYQEANRVKVFREVCQKDMEGSVALMKLGELMCQSHHSLQKLYECSHPNLDRLVELGKGKALGSRLTGAGWGGCIVALTTKDTVDDYIKTLKEKFYKENPAAFGKDLDSLVFATEPNVGAEIYEMKM